MSDLLSDIEESFRQERLNRLWKRWFRWIIAAIVLLIIGILGWTLWRETYKRTLEEASDRLYAMTLSESSVHALETLEDLDKSSSHHAIATLVAAQRLRSEGKIAEANDQLTDFLLADHKADPLLMGLIRLAIAWSSIEQRAAPQTEIEALLEPELNGPYHWAAQETIAWAALENGSYERARSLLTILRDGRDVPLGIQTRAKRVLLSLGGDSRSPIDKQSDPEP